MAEDRSPDQAAAQKSTSPPIVSVKQLAARVAEQQGLKAKQVGEIMASLAEIMTGHLKTGARVRLNQLGLFEVKIRPARTVRNPATGQSMDVAESKKIAFRPAKELKEAVAE